MKNKIPKRDLKLIVVALSFAFLLVFPAFLYTQIVQLQTRLDELSNVHIETLDRLEETQRTNLLLQKRIEDLEVQNLKPWMIGNPYTTELWPGALQSENVTCIDMYASAINESSTGGKVKVYNMVVENGTSYPSSPTQGQVFLRSDHDVLYAYDGGQWLAVGFRDYANLTGTPDLTVYVLTDGSRTLTADWNVGTHGIYGITTLNATDIWISGSVPQTHLEWGSLEASASYIVFKNGSTYYMRNGTTGAVDWSSSNASAVINNAIGNASSVKGNVFIKSSTYNLTGSIVHKSNVGVYMEEGAHLKLDDGENKDLWVNSDQSSGGDGNENMTIYGGHLDGNKAGQTSGTIHVTDFMHCNHVKIQNVRVSNGYVHGINIHGCTDWVIEGCTIEDWNWNGISTGQWYSFWPMDAMGRIVHNYLEGGSDVGIQLGENTEIVVDSNIITGCNGTTGDANSGWGIGLEGGTSHCIISNNEITWCKSGIVLDSTAGNALRNQIVGNHFRKIGYDAGSGHSAIWLKTGCDHNVVSGNVGSDWLTSASYFIRLQTSYNVISNNKGRGLYLIYLDGGDNNIIEGNHQIDSYLIRAFNSADDNVIANNHVWYVAVSVYRGIWIESGSRNEVSGNKVKATGGGTKGIYIQAGSDNRVFDNELSQCQTKITDTGTNTRIKNNVGYNPVGYIANPVSGSNLVDSGAGAIANNTQYTCWQSPKTLYISGGTVNSVQVEGQEVFTGTNVMVVLQPSDTFKIVWSDAPTIKVMGL